MNKNRTALVTGGAVRLGKALALALAHQGYDIALHYNRSAESAQATMQAIQELGVRCQAFPYDFSAKPEIAPLIETVQASFPNLNVLVNSASVYHQATLLETDRSIFEEQFKVNFQAPYFLIQAFAKHCQHRRIGGNIINIIDNKISFHQYQYSAYLLFKKTLADLTQLAAAELGPDIRVNGISPGVILPGETRTKDYVSWREQGIPLQRTGALDNITQALQFILENDFLNGQILTIDGGESVNNTGQNAVNYGI